MALRSAASGLLGGGLRPMHRTLGGVVYLVNRGARALRSHTGFRGFASATEKLDKLVLTRQRTKPAELGETDFTAKKDANWVQTWDNLDPAVNLENFPYYLHPAVREGLEASALPHLATLGQTTKDGVPTEAGSALRHLGHVGTAVVLLDAVPGTERYCRALAQAVARSFHASFAVFDHDERLGMARARIVKAAEEKMKTDVQRDLWKQANTMAQTYGHPSGADSRARAFMELYQSDKEWHHNRLLATMYEEVDAQFVTAWKNFLQRIRGQEPVVVYFKDFDKIVAGTGMAGVRLHAFNREWESMRGIVIGSRFREPEAAETPQEEEPQANRTFVPKPKKSTRNPQLDRLVDDTFPMALPIHPPAERNQAKAWEEMVKRDIPLYNAEVSDMRVRKVLSWSKLQCVPLPNPEKVYKQTEALSILDADKVGGWAVSAHLREQQRRGRALVVFPADGSRSGVLGRVTSEKTPVISMDSLEIQEQDIVSALGTLQRLKEYDQAADPEKHRVKMADLNKWEQRLMADVVRPTDVKIGFGDIGALDEVKMSLREMVTYPLLYPDLFGAGKLVSRSSGILMFGPPGTGKTMLASAVAAESGASFMNISMSSITSKWYGESEQICKAVFTLARKLAPCVIFFDELDSAFGTRGRHGEHEVSRRVQNELLSSWDGLRTRPDERVVVMGATNRPFDLDDAVLRRMPRRLLVDVPDAKARASILRLLLRGECIDPSLDVNKLAELPALEGYTGSDLKALAMWAAYQPIREFVSDREKPISATGGSGGVLTATTAPLLLPGTSDASIPALDTNVTPLGAPFSGTQGSNLIDGESRPTQLGTAIAKEDAENVATSREIAAVERQVALFTPGASMSTPALRPIRMDDFVEGANRIHPSVTEGTDAMAALREWDRKFNRQKGRDSKVWGF